MKMSHRIVECQARCLFLYLTESGARGLTGVGRSSGAVGRAELGKAFSGKPFSSVPWLLHLGLGAVPAHPAKPCRLIPSPAVPRAGSCRVWIRQGDRDVLRHHPCSGAAGPLGLWRAHHLLCCLQIRVCLLLGLHRRSGGRWKTWNLLHPQRQLQG